MLSKADKMFEKLGFVKQDYNPDVSKNFSTYIARNHEEDVDLRITFLLKLQSYEVYNELLNCFGDGDVALVDSRIHLAIHEKMKELGWINEEDK